MKRWQRVHHLNPLVYPANPVVSYLPQMFRHSPIRFRLPLLFSPPCPSSHNILSCSSYVPLHEISHPLVWCSTYKTEQPQSLLRVRDIFQANVTASFSAMPICCTTGIVTALPMRLHLLVSDTSDAVQFFGNPCSFSHSVGVILLASPF